MAEVTRDEFLKYAVQILRRFRCGFDKCVAHFDYIAMRDELAFVAVGNITLVYNMGNVPIDYTKLLIDLAVTKWSDPIC